MAATGALPLVLLTRPEGENDSLRALLAARGFEVRVRPMIRLSAAEDTPGLRRMAQALDRADRIIFVSKAAVRFGMVLLDRYWPQWPAGLVWYAVGAGTGAALGDWGVRAIWPEEAGSEGLLDCLPMDSIGGETILIVRGSGGRELLAERLRAAGAEVRYLEAYRRDPVQHDDLASLPEATIAVATSGEITGYLAGALGSRTAEIDLVVPSGRIAAAATEQGFRRVEIAGGASDQALYDAVVRDK